MILDYDWKFYLDSNPDIVDTLGYSENVAVKHYYTFGINENRPFNKFSSNLLNLMDLEFYRKYLQFDNFTINEAKLHFLKFGIYENRHVSVESLKNELACTEIINRPKNNKTLRGVVNCFVCIDILKRDSLLTKFLNTIDSISKHYNCNLHLVTQKSNMFATRLSVALDLILCSSFIQRNEIDIYRGANIRHDGPIIAFGVTCCNMLKDIDKPNKIYLPFDRWNFGGIETYFDSKCEIKNIYFNVDLIDNICKCFGKCNYHLNLISL